jgi:DNA-binding transcriptional MerR regulator
MRLLEAADVARELGVTPATVRNLADAGRLPVAADTPRGVRLFEPGAVEALKQERARERAAR